MSVATTGFFPAPGTDYTVGDEPTIAQRLNALAQAQGLRLVGLSGYRTPAHSLEVGGFANDPHTRGAASDTPGIQNVSEATLEQYGLTRPFGGAAEADHVQLLPGWTGGSGGSSSGSGGGGVLGAIEGIPVIGAAVSAGQGAVDTASSIGNGISWVQSNWQRALVSAVLVIGAVALLLYGTWLFFRPTMEAPDGVD